MSTVSTRENDPASSARALRAGLVAGVRRRRVREASRRVWQVAPVVGAAGLATAAVAWWARLPVWLPLAVLIAGALVLATYLLLAFRVPAVSDPLARAVDEDAGLGGELRSAGWFAARDQRDPWTDVHVSRAAERLQGVDWRSVYPAVRAPRSGFAAAALTVAAVILATVVPNRGPAQTATSAMSRTDIGSEKTFRYGDTLPPELLQQLERLLAAAEAGDRAAVQALSGSTPLRDMLSGLAHLNDRQLLEALARALAQPDADGQTADALESLAERARRAAEAAGMSAAMQDALEALADELEIARPDQVAERGAPEAGSADVRGGDGPGQAAGAAGLEELTIQFAEATEAGGSTGVMLLSNQDAPDGAGAPGAGVGGAPSTEVPPWAMAEIEAALRQEVVAAHADAPGARVDADHPRRTEQGHATAAFTRGRAAAFDRTPGSAAPPVPEARRSGVRTYFVRPPQ